MQTSFDALLATFLSQLINRINAMDLDKRTRLESRGWKVGKVADFLELTSEESILVEIKLALSQSLKERRQKLMTQSELASKMSSSQPRIAKAENGDASVSIELLIRAMLATGATPQDIGQVIASVG
nr:helix-turn-helix transcriptional regulator [Pseudanabaena sp. lw0831]